jgi:hypothetical protein
LNLAGPESAVDETDKPPGEVTFESASRLSFQQRADGLVKLQYAGRIDDLARGFELRKLPLDGLALLRGQLLFQAWKRRILGESCRKPIEERFDVGGCSRSKRALDVRSCLVAVGRGGFAARRRSAAEFQRPTESGKGVRGAGRSGDQLIRGTSRPLGVVDDQST